MKLDFLVLLSVFVSPNWVSCHEEHGCTHGKLYLAVKDSPTVHVYDLNGELANLTTATTLTVQGPAGQVLDSTETSLVLISTFWGSKENFYTDGRVNFIDTGIRTENHGDHVDIVDGTPKIIENAFLDCGPVYHGTSHNGRIALFCDGSYDSSPQINTTIHIMDPGLFSTDQSPIIFNTTIQSSHHGFAVSLDGKHFLHSIPTEDRVNRVANGTENPSSLPNSVHVVDYEGNVIGSKIDCDSLHGSSHVGNTYGLACSQDIVIVDFDPQSATFNSKAISYPDTLSEVHRSGSLYGHEKSEYIVGDYADWDAEEYTPHLIYLKPSDTTLTDANVLVLPEGQCVYAFEKAEGNLILVLEPNGTVKVYEVDPWKVVAETKVGTNFTSCDSGTLISGYVYAFVLEYEAKMVYALDLHDVKEGRITVHETKLAYIPFAGTVAGVPNGTACTWDEDHDHGEESTSNASIMTTSSSWFVMWWTVALGAVTAGLI
jgi:hypothetical protein